MSYKPIVLIATISFFYIWSPISCTDYCAKTLCRGGTTHIACNKTRDFADSCPKNAQLLKFNDANIEHLLEEHNAKRHLIASGKNPKYRPACRMATLQWNNELALLAEYNVMQCSMHHDFCHNTMDFQYSGQNLFKVTVVGKAGVNLNQLISYAVASFYREHRDTKLEYLLKYPLQYIGPLIGHFTLLVAERNTHVGCAAAKFQPAPNKKIYIIICNYATTNMKGKPIYNTCDKPAVRCKQINPKFPALCSPQEIYALNIW